MDVNLLPWREDARRQQINRALYKFLAAIFGLTTIIILINQIIVQRINQQIYINKTISAEISRCTNDLQEMQRLQKTQQDMMTKLNKIQILRSSQSSILHILYELTRVIPDDIAFTQIERHGEHIFLNGHSGSTQSIASLLENIANNPWLHKPNLLEMKQIEARHAFKVLL